MARDEGKRIPLELVLQVMKHLLEAKDHSRVIRLYRILRMGRLIGQGSRASARMTTMASCYGAQASEVWKSLKGGCRGARGWNVWKYSHPVPPSRLDP